MSYTSPIKVSKEDWEKFYHRFKDIVNAIQHSKGGIAVNPHDAPMVKDLLERLIEDDTWQHGKKVPMMLHSITVKRGEILAVDPKTMEIASMRQLLQADSGFGRFRGLAVPNGMDGLHNPWRRPDHG